tara:strand:+ start:1121 stop:1849 length:729 start_codon:yes stop_codon:yes gene_type:complete
MNILQHICRDIMAVNPKGKLPILMLIWPILVGGISCNSGNSNIDFISSDFDSKVLFQNSNRLEMLIEKEDVADLVGVSVNKIKAFYEDYGDQSNAHFLLFSWPANHSISLGSGVDKVEITVSSSIGFGRISEISQEEFDRKYQPKTEASVKAAIVAITSDESIDSDEAIWEAKEIALNAKSQRVERLENKSSVAYWEMPINALHVWVDGVEITISSSVDENADLNKKKALELLKLILKSPTD